MPVNLEQPRSDRSEARLSASRTPIKHAAGKRPDDAVVVQLRDEAMRRTRDDYFDRITTRAVAVMIGVLVAMWALPLLMRVLGN